MDQLRIVGGRPLKGTVRVSGSKNSTLPIMAGALLASRPVTLHRVPDLGDVVTMTRLLEKLGATVERDGDRMRIDARGVSATTAPYELVRAMRASFLVLGPLLARLGKASVAQPGGDAIGHRPVDMHIAGFKALGAKVTSRRGLVSAQAKRLVGGEIELPFPSVGATESIMLAAAGAKGETIIANAAREPEIEDLAAFLEALGATVTGAGTGVITMKGAKRLGGADHTMIPDRIETATWLIAAAVTRTGLTVAGAAPDHVQPIIVKLREAGVQIKRRRDSLRITVPASLRPVNVRTEPHPGFPTDAQAQMLALLATVPGTSTVVETIFENRFMHVAELERMGANIRLIGNTAIVEGGARLTGAPVVASDLRASAALILAALVAKGETVISGIYHLDRGYERIDEKLAKLGANVKRLREDAA